MSKSGFASVPSSVWEGTGVLLLRPKSHPINFERHLDGTLDKYLSPEVESKARRAVR